MSDSKKNAELSEKEEKKAKKAKSDADSKKSKKSDKDKKKNLFARIGNWFKDLKREFKRVAWPNKKTVFNNTLVVLGVIVVGSAFIGLLDLGFLKLMNALMNL
ncbi:MAG: preprotein translocase subunit SecE [Ruminococcus sp.]